MRASLYLDSIFQKEAARAARMFQFSRNLACVFGFALPILETIRRFHQLGDIGVWPMWLDDILLGVLLLTGARLTSGRRYHNAKYLVAAWGVTCGMGYASFFGQVLHLDLTDPAGIPSLWVAVIKGCGFALAIVALIGALKSAPAADDLSKHPERLEEMLDPTDDA
ncbi:MAG: hypothetical protein ABI769_13985 [Pseudomonadota bacterium]